MNVKNGSEKYLPGPEILTKTSQNERVWFGNMNFGLYLGTCGMILKTIFMLHHELELMPVVLSTMNPINETNL